MNNKRRALGRGLGALIPSSPGVGPRPVDVFFPGAHAAPPASDDPDDVVGVDVPGQHLVADDRAAGTSGAEALAHDGQAAEADLSRERGPDTRPGEANRGREPDIGGEPGAMGTARSRQDPTGKALEGQAMEGTALDAGGPEAGAHRATTGPDGLAPVPGATFAELPVSAIARNPRQPRTVFDEDDMAELVESVREIGILQPVVVRRATVSGQDAPAYELIMGERRWRASQAAGRTTVPAIIKDTADDDLLRDALLENLHRAQLNPLEEAAAYQQLLDDFGCTQEELATRLSRSRPQVTNTLRLLRLPPLVARRLAAGVLSAGHARALLGLHDGAAMERLAQRIVAEGLSVRSVEEIVAVGGDDSAPAPRRPRAAGRHPQVEDLAARLSDRLDTRVTIAIGARRGKLTVEFASVDDLHRILDAMNLPTEG